MIDFTNGSITPEGLPTLSPFMSADRFLGIYPESMIRYAHTPEKGSHHYFLAPAKLFGEDCNMALCFEKEVGLTQIRFSVAVEPDQGPIEKDGVEKPVSKNWKPQDESNIKNANDAFLLNHCAFTKKDRSRNGQLEKTFDWGSVVSFYDNKGCSSDIVLRFSAE